MPDVITNPYQISHLKKRAFLTAFANSGNIRAACRAAGVARRTYYDWTEHDEQFSGACHQAKADFGDALEAKCADLALREGNVTALIVALKMAGRFVDTQRNEHSGPGGAPIRTEQKVNGNFNFESYADAYLAATGRPTGELEAAGQDRHQ